MSLWSSPLAQVAAPMVGQSARVAALCRYADDLEARIAAGDADADLPEEARAARAAALMAGGA